MNPLRVLCQELNLLRRLDCNSFHGTNFFDGGFSVIALGNKKRGQDRPCPAKTGLTVNCNWPLLLALLNDEVNELLCLLNRRRAAIRHWQT